MARFARLVLSTAMAVMAAASTTYAASSSLECAKRFHAALQGDPLVEFTNVEAQRKNVRDGDARLPGEWIFEPPTLRRTPDEKRALKVAYDVVVAKGRPAWRSSANSRWIVDRTIADLSDFLNQDITPYLCGGVDNYVSVLRGYIDRVVSVGGRPLDVLRRAQAERARESVKAAMAAMKPVPKPRYAPDLRPIAIVQPPNGSSAVFALRRGGDTKRARGEGLLFPAAQSARRKVHGPQIDPDLPIKVEAILPLATEADRLSALNTLVVTALGGGFLAEDPGDAATLEKAETDGFRPVLKRLSSLRSMVAGPDGRNGDPLVRKRLIGALSDIEILDSVAHAGAAGGDPMLVSIEALFEAILKARETALDEAGE